MAGGVVSGDLNGSGDAAVPLPAILDLTAADDLLAAVRQRVAIGAPWLLDASAVETLTLPCAQIILAANRAAPGMAIQNPSAAFTKAFADLGIALTAPVNLVETASGPAAGDTADGGPTSATNGESPSPEASAAEQVQKRILTIDDSKTIRDMLRFTLLDAGYDVLQAVDGQDGLEVLERETVDVVITDINMPKLDGYGVLREIRKQPEYRSMPILVLTTENNDEKKNLARDAGATGWMVKPFDPAQLLATIRRVSP